MSDMWPELPVGYKPTPKTIEELLLAMPAYLHHAQEKWFFVMSREISGRKWQVGYERNVKGDNVAFLSFEADNPKLVLRNAYDGLKERGLVK